MDGDDDGDGDVNGDESEEELPWDGEGALPHTCTAVYPRVRRGPLHTCTAVCASLVWLGRAAPRRLWPTPATPMQSTRRLSPHATQAVTLCASGVVDEDGAEGEDDEELPGGTEELGGGAPRRGGGVYDAQPMESEADDDDDDDVASQAGSQMSTQESVPPVAAANAFRSKRKRA